MKRGDPGFRVVDIPAARAGEWPDALRQIHDRELDVLILRGAVPAGHMAAAAAALAAGDAHFPRTPSEDPDLSRRQVYVLGVSMTPSRIPDFEPYLASYLDQVTPFRAAAEALFPAGDGFFDRLQALLESLSGGRPVAVFSGADGRPYTPATIRTVPPGCEIPLHSGLDFLSLEGYGDLKHRLDSREQLSFFSVIDPPEAGGEILVYAADFWDPDKPRDERGFLDGARVQAEADYQIFQVGPGDVFLFAGGRWYHRVTPVAGGRTRRTIGGFLGFSPDGGAIYYWS